MAGACPRSRGPAPPPQPLFLGVPHRPAELPVVRPCLRFYASRPWRVLLRPAPTLMDFPTTTCSASTCSSPAAVEAKAEARPGPPSPSRQHGRSKLTSNARLTSFNALGRRAVASSPAALPCLQISNRGRAYLSRACMRRLNLNLARGRGKEFMFFICFQFVCSF
jgi:hypothetical protein